MWVEIPTFLVAGHETTRYSFLTSLCLYLTHCHMTSVATAWALYALSIDRRIQTTLRNELISVPTETPTMDELNALPYLDAVVRETLRIHSPVANSGRVAMRDDSIPVGKAWKDKKGVNRSEIQ
jgi:cytochrome P450